MPDRASSLPTSLEILADALRRYRDYKGLTLRDVADRSGGKIDPSYLGRIERAEQTPSLPMLDVILGTLGVPLHKLLVPELTGKGVGRSSVENDLVASLNMKIKTFSEEDLRLLHGLIDVVIANKKRLESYNSGI